MASSDQPFVPPPVRRVGTPVEGRVEDAVAAAPARPTHRLTPQAPYQASPQAWLDSFDGTYSAGPGVNQIWWRLPALFPTEFMATCNLTFAGVPAKRRVFRLTFEVWPQSGATGQVVVDVGSLRTEFPVATSESRTVAIPFHHDGSDPLVVMVLMRQGIYDFVFHRATLGAT